MRFTQRLAMHLNGGNKFSEMRYDVLADGKPTGFKRLTRTNGSPRYVKTHDVIWDSANETVSFDVLAKAGLGLQAWLEANVKPLPETTAPASGA